MNETSWCDISVGHSVECWCSPNPHPQPPLTMEDTRTETVTRPDSEKVKLKRRKSSKSSKRPTRKHSIKVRQKRSLVRRSVSSARKGRAVRTKSFIVKRRSFLRPTRWSSYLREERKGGFQKKIKINATEMDIFCRSLLGSWMSREGFFVWVSSSLSWRTAGCMTAVNCPGCEVCGGGGNTRRFASPALTPTLAGREMSGETESTTKLSPGHNYHRMS